MSDVSSDDEVRAVVLDYLPHGHSEADKPQYQRAPVAFAVGEESFRLYELKLAEDADISIGDRVLIQPDFEAGIDRGREVDYDDLSDGARSELEYVVEEIVEDHAGRFVDFYNDAQPVSLRMHQLDLLPGIGDKLRDNILDERKRNGPFESFADLEDRVSGLHNPKEKIVDRIEAELTGEDLKYHIFAQN